VDSHIHFKVGQKISWDKMVLPGSKGAGIEVRNWPVGVPFVPIRGMPSDFFRVLKEALEKEQTPEGRDMAITFRERV
jgi:hypothetical protein